MARVALCAIMKDEGLGLLEWLAWHRLGGFDPVIVYSNDTTDGSLDLLDALDACGIVAHRRQETLDDGSAQHAAYNDALAQATTEWMAFLDADEFYFSAAQPDVRAFVENFGDAVSGVAVNWRLFGSGGRRFRAAGLVIENFTRASAPDYRINRHFKSIVRPERVASMAVHFARLKHGDYVDADCVAIPPESVGKTDRIAVRARINHYFVKSLEEFEAKRRRGAADRARGDPQKYTLRDGAAFLDGHDRNDVEDFDAARRAPEVWAEIGRLTEVLRRSGFLVFRS